MKAFPSGPPQSSLCLELSLLKAATYRLHVNIRNVHFYVPCDDRIALRTHNDEIRGQVFTLRLAMFCRGLATQKDSAFSDVNCLLIFSSLGTMQGQVEVESVLNIRQFRKKIKHFLKMGF